jgi:hypothetical protein
MRMWRTIVVVAVVVGAMGSFLLLNAAPGGPQPDGKAGETKVEAKRTCRKGHVLRSVPMLLGLPSTNMSAQVKRGEALLGGCMGNPDKLERAFVCEKCREWKTDGMVYWQPLPKDFGTVKE